MQKKLAPGSVPDQVTIHLLLYLYYPLNRRTYNLYKHPSTFYDHLITKMVHANICLSGAELQYRSSGTGFRIIAPAGSRISTHIVPFFSS